MKTICGGFSTACSHAVTSALLKLTSFVISTNDSSAEKVVAILLDFSDILIFRTHMTMITLITDLDEFACIYA